MTTTSLEKHEPSCALCGAPAFPECPHESRSMQVALEQAIERWNGISSIKDWALHHARNSVLSTFNSLRATRFATHTAYIQSLPCYTLYYRYGGNPPITPQQLHLLLSQIAQAEHAFRQGIDEDWRRCCLKYPEVLDYFLGLVDLQIPAEGDERVREPVFRGGGGGGGAGGSVRGGGERRRIEGGSKKKERRRTGSRGATPPAPDVPLARGVAYRRL